MYWNISIIVLNVVGYKYTITALARVSAKNIVSYEWQIIEKISETPNTNTYVLSPTSSSQRFAFRIGEFVTLQALLKRPTKSGNYEENMVERAYSIASSPLRSSMELTIKKEKPYGYINPVTGKADGFAAYFFEQIKVGDKIKLKPDPRKDHFLSKVAAGIEKDVSYWSGSNGAESARCLIQFMEDTKDPDLKLTLFYSNPYLYTFGTDGGSGNGEKIVNVIYYKWLIEMAKKMENNLRLVFSFTREKEELLPSNNDNQIFYRRRRFFVDANGKEERTLSIYHENPQMCFNPICGSSGFISGAVRLPSGTIERRNGIMQYLMQLENVKRDKIDVEQYYLESVAANPENIQH